MEQPASNAEVSEIATLLRYILEIQTIIDCPLGMITSHVLPCFQSLMGMRLEGQDLVF